MKRLSLDTIWVLLAVALLGSVAWAADATTETDYMAILLQGKKVGHAVHTRVVENGQVTTTEMFSMTLGRGGQAVNVKSEEKHVETSAGKPLSFEMAMTASGMEQKTTGTIKDGMITISRQVMGQPQQQTVPWPEDAMLSEGMRLAQEKHGLKPGTKYEVSMFRPDMLMGVTAEVEVGPKTKIGLFGRSLELSEVKTTMIVQDQRIEMTGYVDAELKAKKTLVPMMGMTMEMVACDKAFAMQEDDLVDFLDKLSVKSPVKLMNLKAVESATYLLKPTTDRKLELIETSAQTVNETPEGMVVTVAPVQAPEKIAFPYKGDDPKILAALESTDYLQSDNEEIVGLAKRAVGKTKDAAEAARQIEAFVDGYITQKDLSVGYASAAEVAQSRQGDCSEHAVLVAAMCRAVGIPARIVCGMVYADSFLSKQSIFGGHMWAEAYIGDKWVGLDATRSELGGFGPGHIALSTGNGDPTDFFSLVNTLGCFEIKKITLNKKKQVAEATIE